ncbi:nucleolar protein dao-5-like [Halyomorpha halys]|uniref:nucleolar protein dao-5-like n=1 Tax=Halyomorpha halys TaxID=286706 RepID=UPI0006D51CF1
MAHSNFLHRLAKAEEKKVKKRASMSSLFGDIHQHDEVEASSPEKGDEQKVTAKSPLVQTPTDGKDSKADVNKAEVKEAEDKKLPLNQTPVNGKDKMNDSNEEEEVKIKEIEEKKLPLNQTSVSGKDKKNDLNKEEVKIKEVEEKKLPLNGKSSPAIPSVVTVVTTPNRKRGVKQPELLLSQESKKSVTKAIPTPPPPSYFEEEAMDYVIVPPKPKSTPLTEHQKEMLSKRRSDIPALYQDLSQDTQSMNSQSIKEIIMLKEIKLNDTTKSSEVITTKDDETSNTPARTDEENNKKEQAEKMLIENGTSDKIVEDSQEIINDTQPNHDSGVNLSLTPTKHTSTLPTQKNLLNKFNLLECDENGESKKVDEEDEVEKENKIVNIEEVQKVTPIKRRSSRKSTNKYLTKKSEETPKNKTKKDISESTATAELISKGKSKKSLETAGKNSDNTSFLKVKNSDPQDGLKELEVNGIKESEKKFTESISCAVVKEETKSLINPFPTDTKEKPIENTSKKTENEISEIIVPSNKTEIDDKLDKVSTKNETCDLPSKNEFKDVTPSIVAVMSASESVVKEIEESTIEKNSESKSSTPDVSTTDISKETNIASNKNEIPVESLDISKKESHISSETKDKGSEEVLKPNANSELTNSLRENSSETEKNLNESKNVISGASDKGISTEEPSTGSLNDQEPSDILNSSSDSDVIIVDDNETNLVSENSNISNGNVETKLKVGEQEDMEHNSSADSNAASWSMVTPEKKARKRRVSEVTSVDKFSPKLLRSKRLSLTKLTPDSNSSESNKKNGSASKLSTKGNKIGESDASGKKITEDKKKANKKSSSVEITNTVGGTAENTDSIKSNGLNNMESKTSSPESEVSGERKASKRKNPDQTISPPSEPKKAKTDLNTEEASKDSLALLKNSSVKPRKKKIIKSNIKASPNNLEQWLIKSGKSVVKKTLLSSNDQNDVQSESKIFNNNSEIQISSSEPKKIIVEMSPVSKATDSLSPISKGPDNSSPVLIVIDNSSTSSEGNITESQTEVALKVQKNVAEVNVVKVEKIEVDNVNEDSGIPSVIEPEMFKTRDNDLGDDIETIERQFLEAIKRSEAENNKQSVQYTDNLLKPKSKRPSEEEDDDEQLLTESLKCDETELDRTSLELDRNSNASRVKLESMIYAKYKTTLRRPRRRKRLLRRVKKDDDNDLDEELEEEEETFDEKRERLVTPFRPSSGRSAQMVKMVTSEEEGPPVTPVRRRSITPLHLTENWPEGRCEQWVPCVPTPPGRSPSLSILKRKASPVVSPTSSPNNKKKRVSFLDPPVSKGLLYSKGSDNIGQVQHANIPPGKRPLWKGIEGETEDNTYLDVINVDEVDEGFGAVEAEDELTAIQEFLNSTPDAPWKDTPLAGDIAKIPGILSCSDPVHNIISRIASPGNETILSEELQRLKIYTIGGFCSLAVSDIIKLSIRPAKVSTLYNVLKDYFQCQPSGSKKSPKVKLQDDSSKSTEDAEKMDFVETQIEITTLGIEMGVQVDPSEICSDDTFVSQMSQKIPQDTQDLILTPPVVKEPELYSDSQEDIKIPTRDEIGLMFQSDVFIKRAAPFVNFNFLSKLTAAAAEYFGTRPD